jgi:hypothetical protein
VPYPLALLALRLEGSCDGSFLKVRFVRSATLCASRWECPCSPGRPLQLRGLGAFVPRVSFCVLSASVRSVLNLRFENRPCERVMCLEKLTPSAECSVTRRYFECNRSPFPSHCPRTRSALSREPSRGLNHCQSAVITSEPGSARTPARLMCERGICFSRPWKHREIERLSSL